MTDYSGIDLHMHTTVSDGTDSPEEMIETVKNAGIGLFSVTDHDAIRGCSVIREHLKDGDPAFINGMEFSTKDEDGKYHILGYGYDPAGGSVNALVDKGHSLRMKKVEARIRFLENEFGFSFPEEELKELFSRDNPGKPHIGNMMVKHGYAGSKEDAIINYINKLSFKTEYVRPEDAISAILESGGVPVLAHPFYGSGDELIIGDEMEERLKKLMGYGLLGVEAFYSGFTDRLIGNMLGYADKYDLYVTAGSDYHGSNKMIDPGDTNYKSTDSGDRRIRKFIERAMS